MFCSFFIFATFDPGFKEVISGHTLSTFQKWKESQYIIQYNVFANSIVTLTVFQLPAKYPSTITSLQESDFCLHCFQIHHYGTFYKWLTWSMQHWKETTWAVGSYAWKQHIKPYFQALWCNYNNSRLNTKDSNISYDCNQNDRELIIDSGLSVCT